MHVLCKQSRTDGVLTTFHSLATFVLKNREEIGDSPYRYSERSLARVAKLCVLVVGMKVNNHEMADDGS